MDGACASSSKQQGSSSKQATASKLALQGPGGHNNQTGLESAHWGCLATPNVVGATSNQHRATAGLCLVRLAGPKIAQNHKNRAQWLRDGHRRVPLPLLTDRIHQGNASVVFQPCLYPSGLKTVSWAQNGAAWSLTNGFLLFC